MWIRVVNLLMRARHSFLRRIEIAINSPHRVQLCASHSIIYDTSDELFSWKNWDNRFLILSVMSLFVRREGSRRHMQDRVGISGKVMDTDIG